MSSMTASAFSELVAPLGNLVGLPYYMEFQKILVLLSKISTPESHMTPESVSSEWEQFAEKYHDQILGQHITSHAAELGDPHIIRILEQHTETFSAHIETYFNGKVSSHPSVSGHITTHNQYGTKETYTPHPCQVTNSSLEAILVTQLTFACRYMLTADIGSYQKAGLEGYQKPFNIRYILKVRGLRRQKRAVLVGQEDAKLVRRHGGGGDLAFEVTPGATLLETSYHDTIVVTYWVHIPLPETDARVKWTFGTAYVSDTFPYSQQSLLNKLNTFLKKPESINQTEPSVIKNLVSKLKRVHALLPPS